MDWLLVKDNVLDPPILFFFLGMAARLVKSDLDVPTPVARLLSLYLLLSIGMQGGHKLALVGVNEQVLLSLGAAVALAFAVPVWSFFVLRWKLDVHNAAAVAATYGSISAVTFITAAGFLDRVSEPYSGHMVAAMALMESPAIIVGVLLVRWFAAPAAGEGGAGEPGGRPRTAWGPLLREACLNGAVFLLLGSLCIGMLTGEHGWKSVEPLVQTPFKGVLCLFLLDMGLVAAQRLRDLRRSGPLLVTFAIGAPVVHALIGIAVAWAIGATPGDALLLAVLAGSASYIAVPAAMRLSIPQASPSLYVPMALGLTFPFNVTLGIPLYMAVIRGLW